MSLLPGLKEGTERESVTAITLWLNRKALRRVVKLQSPLLNSIRYACCSLPSRPGSSRRASPPKPISCRPAACGCTRSSMTASASLPARTGARVRLYGRPGNDFTRRFPLIVETLARLRSRSCIIAGEAVASDDKGVASFDLVRYHREAAASAGFVFWRQKLP